MVIVAIINGSCFSPAIAGFPSSSAAGADQLRSSRWTCMAEAAYVLNLGNLVAVNNLTDWTDRA